MFDWRPAQDGFLASAGPIRVSLTKNPIGYTMSCNAAGITDRLDTQDPEMAKAAAERSVPFLIRLYADEMLRSLAKLEAGQL